MRDREKLCLFKFSIVAPILRHSQRPCRLVSRPPQLSVKRYCAPVRHIEYKKMQKNAVTAIAVLILLLAYPFWKIHKAKTRVNHFSKQISVGMSIETAETLARKFDLKIIRGEESITKPSKFIAWDGWVFARWTCFISYRRGKIFKIEVLFLD